LRDSLRFSLLFAFSWVSLPPFSTLPLPSRGFYSTSQSCTKEAPASCRESRLFRYFKRLFLCSLGQDFYSRFPQEECDPSFSLFQDFFYLVHLPLALLVVYFPMRVEEDHEHIWHLSQQIVLLPPFRPPRPLLHLKLGNCLDKAKNNCFLFFFHHHMRWQVLPSTPLVDFRSGFSLYGPSSLQQILSFENGFFLFISSTPGNHPFPPACFGFRLSVKVFSVNI